MPTLGQVLRSPGLELQVVVAGTGDPPVRWVATSELVDPTPFLEGGEIVLTTGLATGEWTEEWQSYVDRLAAARVTALGLGLGLTHARVPARLRDAARAVDLPLFTVAHAVPFVAVSRTVARLVQREEQQALRAAMSVQQQLTRDAAGTDGAEAVLRRLARIVSGDAVVCDPDGAVLLRETVVRDQRAPDRIPESIRALIACLRPDGLRTSHTDTGPRGSTLVQPLGLAGSPHSYLVLSTPAPWGTTAPTVVATAAALLSLAGERRTDALAAAREIRGAALGLLLDGQPDAARTLLAVRASGTGPLRADRPFHVLRTGDSADALAGLERWAADDPTDRLAAVPPGQDGRGQPVVLLAAGTDPAGAVAALGAGGRAGLSEARPLPGLSGADDTARAALARTTAERPVARWDEVVDEGLPALWDAPAAAAFGHAVLGPLGAPSAENAQLLATLDAFHEHRGQLTVVAAALGVHRNTVRRRLRRVEELTGRSPASPRGRAELWVAAEILRRSRRGGHHGLDR
jgi:PucR family transcriptional regulator, purine catabolism regulatory protein